MFLYDVFVYKHIIMNYYGTPAIFVSELRNYSSIVR